MDWEEGECEGKAKGGVSTIYWKHRLRSGFVQDGSPLNELL